MFCVPHLCPLSYQHRDVSTHWSFTCWVLTSLLGALPHLSTPTVPHGLQGTMWNPSHLPEARMGNSRTSHRYLPARIPSTDSGEEGGKREEAGHSASCDLTGSLPPPPWHSVPIPCLHLPGPVHLSHFLTPFLPLWVLSSMPEYQIPTSSFKSLMKILFMKLSPSNDLNNRLHTTQLHLCEV